jgi:hypothetical protein
LAELCCVDPAQVAKIWPHVADLIRRAMQRGRMGRFTDVEADVLGGNAYLWLAIDGGSVLATAVTKVTAEADERLCTIVACAGQGDNDWPRFGALIEGLEEYARAEGCRALEICGRPGWSRRLKDYRLVKVVIRKDI